MIAYTKHQITEADEQAVLRVLRSGWLAQGPVAEQFEDALCQESGATFCVVTSSGTMALELTWLALRWPLVCVPAITFLATANSAKHAGSTVRFSDCDPLTGLSTDEHCPVFVTLGGQPPTRQYDVVDACHGPIKHYGRLVTILSFHPAKHVACGEGGAVLTNNPVIARAVRELRDAGRDRETKRCTRLGTNGRMNEMSAALGLSQLGRYRENVARRQRIAAQYDEGFAELEHVTPIRHHPDSARHLYQILVPRRAEIQNWLFQAQIQTAVHYRPVSDEPIWGTWELPGAQEHGARTLSIPLFPTLTEAQIAHVIEAVRSVDRRL